MENYTEKYKEIIVSLIIKHLPQAKIILYGSRARGDFQPGSDIDVALDAGEKIDDLLMSKIIIAIDDSALAIPFDIVDFNNVSAEMQNKIIQDGIVWKS